MIDWTKPLQTSENPPHPVRLLADDFKSCNGQCFVVAITDRADGDYERYGSCAEDGSADWSGGLFIQNAPERTSKFQNVYTTSFHDVVVGACLSNTREDADKTYRNGSPAAPTDLFAQHGH